VILESAKVSPTRLTTSEGDATWQQIVGAVSRFLDQPTQYFDGFFSSYKKPALSLAILLGGAMTVKVLASIFDAIDDVPALRELLQLVGIVYSVQFGLRKVYTAEKRDRVFTELKQIWAEITGDEGLSASATKAFGADAATSEANISHDAYNPAEDQRKMFAGVTGTVQVLIPLTGVVDVDALRAKLEKDLGKAEGEIKSLGGRLRNQGFVDQAPAEVVKGARDALAEAEKQAKLVRERLAML
jgi:valyl-tRNA synthetase